MTILSGVPLADYHAHHSISPSKIRVYREDGPLAYCRRFRLPPTDPGHIPHQVTDALLMGQCTEDYVMLDPGEWHQRWAVKPRGMKLSTTEGKAWKASIGERYPIDMDDFAILEDMRSAIMATPHAGEMIHGPGQQLTIRSEIPSLKVSLQSRPDQLLLPSTKAGRVIVRDLKTTTDVTDFKRKIIPYGYHIQLAVGHWLLAREGYIDVDLQLVVVEKKLAARCRVYRMTEETLELGWRAAQQAIEGISSRLQSGDWYDIQSGIEDVEVPRYQLREEEQDIDKDSDHA